MMSKQQIIEQNRQKAVQLRKQAEDRKRKAEQFKHWTPANSEYHNASMSRDTKAGFLSVAEDAATGAKAKKKRALYEHELFPVQVEEETGADSQMACQGCHSISVDMQYLTHYACLVCPECITADPERYTLLTKTEVLADYLITAEQLRSNSVSSADEPFEPVMLTLKTLTDKLRYWDKANPQRSKFARMHLYLKYQVEEYVFKHVWESEEQLDAEFDKRDKAKQQRAQAKRAADLKEMRKRIMPSVKRATTDDKKAVAKKAEHQHEWTDDEDGQRCRTCDFFIQQEEF